MKIYTNCENEKFAEVKTKFGLFYKSLKNKMYYVKTDNGMILTQAINEANDLFHDDICDGYLEE